MIWTSHSLFSNVDFRYCQELCANLFVASVRMRSHFEKEMEKTLQAATLPMYEETREKMNAQFDDLMRQCWEATAYVAKPGAEQKEEQFIKQTKQLSEECEVDMGQSQIRV